MRNREYIWDTWDSIKCVYPCVLSTNPILKNLKQTIIKQNDNDEEVVELLEKPLSYMIYEDYKGRLVIVDSTLQQLFNEEYRTISVLFATYIRYEKGLVLLGL